MYMYARLILIMLFQFLASASFAESNNDDRIKLIGAVNSAIDSALKIAVQRKNDHDLPNQTALREDVEVIIKNANSIDELELMAIVSFHYAVGDIESENTNEVFRQLNNACIWKIVRIGGADGLRALDSIRWGTRADGGYSLTIKEAEAQIERSLKGRR
jgi:hypothetical protein